MNFLYRQPRGWFSTSVLHPLCITVHLSPRARRALSIKQRSAQLSAYAYVVLQRSHAYVHCEAHRNQTSFMELQMQMRWRVPTWLVHATISRKFNTLPLFLHSVTQLWSGSTLMQECFKNINPVNIAVLAQYRRTEVIAGMVPVHHCFTATFVTVFYRFAHRHFTGPVLVNCYPTGISRHNYITLPVSYM